MLQAITRFQHTNDIEIHGKDLTDEEKTLISNYSFLLPTNRLTTIDVFLKYIKNTYENEKVDALICEVAKQNNIILEEEKSFEIDR